MISLFNKLRSLNHFVTLKRVVAWVIAPVVASVIAPNDGYASVPNGAWVSVLVGASVASMGVLQQAIRSES